MSTLKRQNANGTWSIVNVADGSMNARMALIESTINNDLASVFEGNRNINLINGGIIKWGVVANTLSWTKALKLFPAGGRLLIGGVNIKSINIDIGSCVLSNAFDCAYITIPSTDGATATVSVAQYNTITGNDKIIIAIRDTDSCLTVLSAGDISYGDQINAGGTKSIYLPRTTFTADGDFITGTGNGTYGKRSLSETRELLGITATTQITPTMNIGVNTITINNFPEEATIIPNAFHYVNILGRSGNNGDITKWLPLQATRISDTSVKLFGKPTIKVTTDTSASMEHYASNVDTSMYAVNSNEYYFLSCYVKPIIGKAGPRAVVWNGATPINVVACTIPSGDTSQFVRVGVKIQTGSGTVTHIEARMSLFNAAGAVNFTGTTEAANFGGFMMQKITASEFTNDSEVTLMSKYAYGDSVVAMTNPTIDIIKDNLVRNGNCEDGLSYWTVASNGTLIVENGKFKLTSSSGNTKAKQIIQLEPNTNYYIKRNITNGTTTANVFVTTLSETTFLKTNIDGSFNSGNNTLAVVMMYCGDTGTSYYDSIIIIKGTSAPSAYKTQKRTQTTLEGRFFTGDYPILENDQAKGTKSWRETSLYGKDTNWMFDYDKNGFKKIKFPTPIGLTFGNGFTSNGIITKYNGDILRQGDTNLNINNFEVFTDNYTYISISDSDSGWLEAVNPNDDEVKARLNGWYPIGLVGSRYVIFRTHDSLTTYGQDINAYPPGTATTLSVATNNTTSITVTDGSIFKIGDYMAVIGLTNPVAITGVSGNVLSFGSSIQNGGNVGTVVARCDNGTTDLRNLTYCKLNVAPNFDGFVIAYKLANPMPIGINSDEYLIPVKGTSPVLSPGVNTIIYDTGVVRGELVRPSDIGGIYHINDIRGTLLKNKAQNIDRIYKNGIDDTTNWSIDNQSQYCYGDTRAYINSSNIDLNATYTIDYHRLISESPQIGTIGISYRESLADSVSSLYDDVNTRQRQNIALDSLISKSIYEELYPLILDGRFVRATGAGGLRLRLSFPNYKLAIPNITSQITSWTAYDNTGANYPIPRSDLKISCGHNKDVLNVTALYTGTDATIINHLLNNGGIIYTRIIMDCKGVI